MPVCVDCKKEVLKDYQVIETQRKSKVIICNSCMQQYQRKDKKEGGVKNV